MGVAFRVLGSFQALVGDFDVTPSAPKERTLLAVLAVNHDRVVGADRLVDELWPELPAERGRHALQVRIAALRRRFEDTDAGPSITFIDPGYRLAVEDLDVDSDRFAVLVERARERSRSGDAVGVAASFREALELWRGDALADVQRCVSLEEEATRLDGERRGVVEELAEAELASGHHRESVTRLEAMVSEEPFRERRWALLMLALYRCGRQLDALRAFQRARKTLGESGLEPGPQLSALERSISGHDATLELGCPSGTVTFLFTDIEGSTALWDRSPRLMASALARHDALVVDAIAECDGFVFSTGGDGYGAAFSSASAAVRAAMSLQRTLANEEWPADVTIRVRMGLHTGIAEERDNNYFGATVSRAARIADAGNGGQIILSAATAELVADDALSLTDQGPHRLAGFGRPERLYRVVVPDVPDVSRPLRRNEDELGNLPHHRAPLIGRDSERTALDRLLEPGTVVSLTGAGGVGKTRLALAAARAAAHRFADGAWLVELATLVAAAGVPAAVASQLRLHPESDIDAAAIAAILARQERLLVLDNCEHVLDAVTELTDALGRHSPRVTVLATTREALGVDGEHVVAVRPLRVDGGDQISDASRLFCERAAGVLGLFDPTTADLAVVDDICRRLDGLPLAIELAAARLPTMTLAELNSRLGERFALLTRRRGAVERHQSLRTTVGWSYDLLTVTERLVFDRLSVFAGDFDLAAAVAIVGDVADPVEDIVGSLVAKSLVVAIRGDPGTRYQLLETLRQYGEERLEARGETLDFRRRHMRYFLDWSSRADGGLRSASELTWNQAFAVEWHNVRNAFSWACTTNDVQTATMLLRHVGWWATRRIRMEVADWADAALALPSLDDLPVDPIVQSSAAFFAAIRGEVDAARVWFEAATAGAERSGNPDPQVWSIAIWVAPDPEGMLAAARELQRRASMVDDPYWTLDGVIQECMVYMIQSGSRTADVERTAAHIAHIREVLELAEQSGVPIFISHTSMALGGILLRTAPDGALVHLERALELAEAVDAETATISARFQLAALHTTMHRSLDALTVVAPTLERHLRSGAARWLLSGAAYSIRPLLEADHAELATLVLGAVLAALDARPEARRATVYVDQASLQRDLSARLGDAAVEQLLADGRRRPLEDIARQLVQTISELTH